jgi:hypothetical protein
VKNSLSFGSADAVFGYGIPIDVAFVGDWDGDGTDTLGVRRPINPGDDKDCKDFPSKRDAQAYFNTYYLYYGDISRLDPDNDLEACESYFG